LEEEKVGVDAEVEVIESYAPPRFDGESLGQVTVGGAAMSSSFSSKCKTPIALEYYSATLHDGPTLSRG